MVCVSRRTASTKMDRTCKAKCKCKGVDAYAPLGVRFEQTRDGFIPRRRRTVYSLAGYKRALGHDDGGGGGRGVCSHTTTAP